MQILLFLFFGSWLYNSSHATCLYRSQSDEIESNKVHIVPYVTDCQTSITAVTTNPQLCRISNMFTTCLVYCDTNAIWDCLNKTIESPVIGDNPNYDGRSPVCAAAIHAGVIAASNNLRYFRIGMNDQTHANFTGKTRNGITSGNETAENPSYALSWKHIPPGFTCSHITDKIPCVEENQTSTISQYTCQSMLNCCYDSATSECYKSTEHYGRRLLPYFPKETSWKEWFKTKEVIILLSFLGCLFLVTLVLVGIVCKSYRNQR